MSRQSQKQPRPTGTNANDFVFSYEDADLAPYSTPDASPQESTSPGFWGKLGNTGGAIVEGLSFLPGGVRDTVVDATVGFDPTDAEEMARREQMQREQQEYRKKYEGRAFEGVTDAMASMPYSLTTMGSALGAGALAAPAGPLAAGAAGMAASGTTAYRASVAEFERTLYGASAEALGRKPTDEEWGNINAAFSDQATRYGLWEAGPEAISNLLMVKILGPMGSKFKGGVKGLIGRVAGLYGEELATETITQMGQGGIEAEVGLRDTAPGVGEAFGEVAPATFWQTTLMAGGKKGLDLAARRFGKGQDDEGGPLIDEPAPSSPATPQEEASAPETGQQNISINAAKRLDRLNWLGDNAADSEVRQQELAELERDIRMRSTLGGREGSYVPTIEERARQIIEQHSGELRQGSGLSTSLNSGETVDLLTWGGVEENPAYMLDALPPAEPRQALPMAGVAGALGLPEGTGAIPMGTSSTGRQAIATPTEFAMPTVATPYMPRPALPQSTTQGLPQGQWAGGRSQLAYSHPGAEPRQQMQGMAFMGQAAQPQAMPTQAQITSTQQAPRADTTAQAEGLGMPAPQAIPSEERPVQQGQHGVMSAPAASTAISDVPTSNLSGDELGSLSRSKLLDMLTDDKRKEARRKDKSAIREMIRAQVKENNHAQVQVEPQAQPPMATPQTDGVMQNNFPDAALGNAAEMTSTPQESPLGEARPVVKSESQEETIRQVAESPAQEVEGADREAGNGRRQAAGSDGGNADGRDAGDRRAVLASRDDGTLQQPSVQERGVPGEGEGNAHSGTRRDDGQRAAARADQGDAGRVRGEGTSDAVEGSASKESGGQRSSVQGRSVAVKVPGRADVPAVYELAEAEDIQASHLPHAGFQRNPRYTLENERRYHDEPGSRAKVLENSMRLDPAFLLESVDANHGAPVVDAQGNVLGGNGRAMSIQYAYDGEGKNAATYRDALRANAERLGLNQADVGSMKRPVLVRRVAEDMSPEERQALVTAMNDDFKDSREKRSEGITRGERLSEKAIFMLSEGMKSSEAGSLREYFDSSSSAALVNQLMEDGVLQRTERNALVGADGLLNPDGKTKVESALRVLYVNGREALAALPDDTKAKMDVALPHMLRAENVGGEWAILNSVREANDLIVAYKASGHKEPRTFLNQVDMLKGEAPAQSSSPLAVGIFTHALENKKTAFTDRFKRYANAVENSATANALPGIGKPYAAVIEEQFGVKPGTSTKGAEKGTATNEKTSASIPAQQDTARQKKIDDFGEKIGGARKDVWTEWRTSAGKLSEEDVLSKPLEKIFPEPKYDKLLSDGAAPKAVALVHALRDVVTEQKRKLKSRPRLAGDVQKLVESAAKILDSQEYYQRFADSLKANPSLQKILSAASLYEAVGHAKSLAGLRVTSASYSVYNGVRYDPAKIFWTVEKEAPKTAFSNWPRVLAEGVTREEALENFKKAYAKLDLAKPAKKDVSFILYHDQGKVKEVMIGVKVGRNYVPLAGSFATAPDARAYLAENKDALAEKLNRLKEIPNERRDINNPRVGEDMRDGQDVTPEMFSEAFGFRGVEFGNWVEKDRRQSNLNEAYDALMDLAGIIGVTPKALSLNGELGLAFGARGRPARTAGGSVPAAHYEADRVVINITKKSGAGSLAHEWFHAVDNYFSRMRGRSGEYLSDALDVSIASSGGSPVYNAGPLRKEIIDAWSKIRAAITQSGLKARSETLDIVRSNPYWGTNIELGARAFEAYIVEKLQDNNASNDYLVNIVDEKVWSAKGELTGDKKEYPYPTSTELPSIVAAFDNLFQTVEQRETASGVALASLRNVNQQQDDGKLLLSIIAPGQFLPQRNTGSGMRLRDVQRITRALDGIARAAAPVQVVQNYDALPERLRKHFAEQAKELEAAYDPQDGTVYFVADNLTSAERVAEVWLHEQVVHHGLRSLLTEGERKRLLNRLWESSGGMSNADIADIAQRYGLRPTLKQEDRSIVVEEYLALLAEKKKGGLLLSRGDKSVWRRFVEAVAKAWRAMVAKATGGRITSVGSADIDALLTALGEHVMGGLPQEGGTLDTALASLGGGDAKHEASVAAWEQLQRDAEAWGQQLDDYKSTPGGEAGQRELLTVCRTPDVLQKLGAADLPMTMTTGNLGKVLSDKVDHGLPKVLVKQLPHALAQPIMVFESASRSDSFVVLTELKHDGRSVMVAVHLDTERQHVRVNDIASMYKRGNEAWYVRQIEEGRLLYQDKKKSLAWARTNGLQLPKVRKLPARLSDGRILSEVDVVKPLPPSGDVPLASLFDKLTGVEKALKLVENENIQPMFPNKTDLTTLKRTIMLPHWIAKRFPQFGTIYNRQLRRMDERNADKMQSLQSVPSLFGDKKDQLNGKDMDDLRKLIWDNEGKQISELKGTEKFLDADTLANGRSILKENPAWYKAYGKWLEKQPGSTKAKQAMLEVRRSLDSDLMRAHNRMAAMSELSDSDIADHRTTINHQHNYFPHHRYGQWYVQAKVGNEVVFRQHFDAVGRSMAKKKAAEIIAEQRKNYPNAAWRADENEKLPEEVYGAPMDMEAMEQVIKAAASRIGDKEQADSVRSALHEAIADTLKARGWGSHAIGRKGIPGHEDQDILRVLYDYKSGLSGWLTKMEAAKDFTEALGKIDARRHPTEWGYAAQYVKDMLRNYDKIDRLAGNIKSVAFAWYLGANLKTAVLNLTQNVITGVPRLHMDTVGSAGYMRAAMAAIVDQVTGGKGAGLAEDEAQLLQELYDNSVITDGYMEEVRGRVSGVDGAVMWNKLLKGMGWFMSVAERFNRASLALAAYRAARGGNLTQKAQSMHGIEGRADYDQAKAYAETIVRDAHFVYGKANMPEALRSSAAGRAISTAYTFRTFSHNLLSLWSWALRTQGKEGAKMVAKGLSATLLIGGVSSAPFFATAMALFQAFAGDDDDWLETVRGWATEYLGANEMMRDVASYGLPAVAGVNLGGSLKMETPFSQGLKKGSTPKEVLTESIGDIIGIPYDLFVQRPSKVMDAYKNRNAYRMVEEAAPTFVQNAMRAWRLHDDGQKTMSGRDINEPGKKGARKLSEMEMVGKLLGFQPVSATKSYDRYSARQHADKVRSDKAGEFAARMLNARESKNSQDMVEARKDLRQWNEDMRNEGKTWMVIRQEDVQRRMSARRRENKLTPRERGRQKAQSGVWGN